MITGLGYCIGSFKSVKLVSLVYSDDDNNKDRRQKTTDSDSNTPQASSAKLWTLHHLVAWTDHIALWVDMEGTVRADGAVAETSLDDIKGYEDILPEAMRRAKLEDNMNIPVELLSSQSPVFSIGPRATSSPQSGTSKT